MRCDNLGCAGPIAERHPLTAVMTVAEALSCCRNFEKSPLFYSLPFKVRQFCARRFRGAANPETIRDIKWVSVRSEDHAAQAGNGFAELDAHCRFLTNSGAISEDACARLRAKSTQ